MGRIVAIGEGVKVRCYGLAGAHVVVAEDADTAAAAWAALAPDVVLAILTRRSAAAVADREPAAPALLRVVIED